MRIVLFMILGGLLPAGASSAQDIDTGRKVAGMCRTCHGLDGFARVPIAPHIGGEHSEYIKAQLRAFRDGSREHEMMTVVAKGLSDQQISDVADWYSHFEITTTFPSGKPGDNAPELCVACHGANGISEMPDAPNLAGETNIYIETQLKAFRNGKRNNEIMSPIAADLTDADIQAAADWYSSIEIKITAPAKPN